jgi:hypothetical protein
VTGVAAMEHELRKVGTRSVAQVLRARKNPADHLWRALALENMKKIVSGGLAGPLPVSQARLVAEIVNY